ncbi:MAG TPA: 30S ribosomal protein S21 [bacterium]
MPIVIVKEDEPFENALRRFKKLVERAGILSELKRREYYEKPSEVKKRKILASKKRVMRKARRERDKDRWA